MLYNICWVCIFTGYGKLLAKGEYSQFFIFEVKGLTFISENYGFQRFVVGGFLKRIET